MHLLHLDASARRTASLSRQLGTAFVSSWRQRAPDTQYTYRDLAAEPVPHITEAWTEICDTVMREQLTDLDRIHDAVRTPAQGTAWSVIEPLLAELTAADVVLIATPMYNYGVPSALKAWIDQVTFPRMDLSPRRFVVIAARGGDYGPDSPKAQLEHQLSYLSDFITGHFQVPAPHTVAADLGNARIDPLMAPRYEEHEESLERARRGVDDLVAAMAPEVSTP